MMTKDGDGWYRFDGGCRWRCQGPGYLCEVTSAGNVPSALDIHGVARTLRRIRAVYDGRIRLGALDVNGTGLDILIANAMTESSGSVPTPFSAQQLNALIDRNPGLPLDSRLDTMLREVKAAPATRGLVRFEPGYTGPMATPGKVSLGAHHMLISTTAEQMSRQRSAEKTQDQTREACVRMLADSLYSAQLAADYLNRYQGRHYGQLPLIAATYNAGHPRATERNSWHLVQAEGHIDRWLGFYNASRQLVSARSPVIHPAELPKPLPRVEAEAPRAMAARLGEHLSAHFSLSELTASDTARALHIDNTPPPDVVENLRKLAGLLEGVRDVVGARPIHINSAYRSPKLNAAVKGKPNSVHRYGLAADLTCADFGPPLSICRAIEASSLDYDQLIHEYGRWVHIGMARPGTSNRRQSLTIDKTGPHPGLHPVAG